MLDSWKKIIITIWFLSTFSIQAMGLATLKLALQQSDQFILVTSDNLDAVVGNLKRYQRNPISHKWIKIGKTIPVVIGKKGLALDREFVNINIKAPIKKEGDNRSPMGIFKLGMAFGFDKNNTVSKNMDYLAINQNTVCVDDSNSSYYNRVIDSSSVRDPDWQSKEDMSKIPFYQYGAMVEYNNSREPQAGSCIFMHIWETSATGTAGCIAMEEENLKEVLAWLDKKYNPVMGLFTKALYADIRGIDSPR
jgi:D-alanyl-D-alanine dipeptidase